MFVTTEGIDHHVQIADVSGNLTRVNASRPIVAMIHGSGIDTFVSFYFSLHFPLAKLGFTNIMYDRRAHGRTPGPAGTLTIQQGSADLAGILDAVGATAPVHLIGTSYGAAIAIDFAVHYPGRTASVALLDGGPGTEAWRDFMCKLFGRALDKNDAEMNRILASKGSTPQDRRLADSIAMVARTTILQDTAASRVVSVSMLEQLTIPILAIYGARGGAVESSRHELEVAPNFEAQVIPDVGHYLFFEAPLALRRVLSEFYLRHESRLVEQGA